jgi:hypothetical protein
MRETDTVTISNRTWTSLVCGDHPLQPVDPDGEFSTDGGQRDPDDSGIQPGHARTQDGRGQQPPAAGTRVVQA